MSLNSKNLSGKFVIKSLDDEGQRHELSGDLEFDDRFQEFPHRLRLFGYRSDHIRILPYSGYLVDISLLNNMGRGTKTFVGRLHDAGWSTGTLSSEISRIADVDIVKAVTAFERPDDEFKHASYTYTADVSHWPGRGMSQFSFDGSITLRKFKRGIGNLFDGRKIKLEAFPHFYFREDSGVTTRKRLSSITAYWQDEDTDWRRYIEAARIALSFTQVAKLRPMALSHSCGGIYRNVTWDPDALEVDRKGLRDGPIGPGQQRSFHSRAIQRLFKMNYDREVLDSIVDRYVEFRTDATLQQSFSHGCEAIEGIFGLLYSGYREKSRNYKRHGVDDEVRKIIKNSQIEKGLKEIALSRLSNLFELPIWNKIVYLIHAMERDKSALIHKVVRRSNFFKYRNLLAHGRMVRLENEVVFQQSLMRFVLEWLFIRLCGSKLEPTLGVLEADLERSAAPDLGLIRLWE